MCTLGALALRRRGWCCGEILGVLQYHRLSQILVRLGPRVLSAARGGSPRGLDPGWVSVHPGSLVATCTLAPRLDLGPSPTGASLPWGVLGAGGGSFARLYLSLSDIFHVGVGDIHSTGVGIPTRAPWGCRIHGCMYTPLPNGDLKGAPSI